MVNARRAHPQKFRFGTGGCVAECRVGYVQIVSFCLASDGPAGFQVDR